MSIPQLSSSDLDFKNTVTPLWSVLENAHSKPRYNIPKTFQNCQWNKIQSQNGISNTQIVFPLYNVNTTALLENCMHLRASITCTFNGTNTTGGNYFPLQNGMIAPRQFPFNSAIANSSIDLGGSNPIITSVQEFFPQAVLFGNDAMATAYSYSDCAGQVDVSPNYPINDPIAGSSRNPLNTYVNGNYGAESRLSQCQITAFSNTQVANNAAYAASLTFTTFEPLFARCLTLNPKETSCFIGCSNSSTVTLTTANFSNRVISYAPNAQAPLIGVISCAFTEAPSLYYNTFTLPQGTILPEYSLYHMYGYNNNSTSTTDNTNGALQNFGSAQLNTVSFQDSLINRAIYVWAGTSKVTDRPASVSDYGGLEITGVNIQYAGQQSQFNGMDNYQLYDMFHKRQGGIRRFCEMNYATSFAATANPQAIPDEIKKIPLGGSCLRIPAEMITGYDQSLYAVGSQISQNLQVTLSVRWTGTNATAPNRVYAYVQCVDDSILAISNGMTQELAPAIFISPDVIKAVKSSPVYLTSSEAETVGGDFFKDLKKGVSAASKLAEPLVKAARGKGGSLVNQNELQRKLMNL